MAKQVSHINDYADRSCQSDDHSHTDTIGRTAETDDYAGDTNITDAEILLREWCGVE